MELDIRVAGSPRNPLALAAGVVTVLIPTYIPDVGGPGAAQPKFPLPGLGLLRGLLTNVDRNVAARAIKDDGI